MSRLQELLVAAAIVVVLLVGYVIASTGRYQPIIVEDRHVIGVIDTWTGTILESELVVKRAEGKP